MPNTWFTADLHLGHEKTCTVFKREDGTPLRPFKDGNEMDEEIVKRWNERVRPNDKVYVLGDVVIARRNLPTLSRLPGDKVLVSGNHDLFKLSDYLKYFRTVYAVRVLSDMILTHIPIHRDSLTQRYGTNVHGHLHANRVMIGSVVDPRYLCVSVEQTDYAPIDIEEVRRRIQEQREAAPDYV